MFLWEPVHSTCKTEVSPTLVFLTPQCRKRLFLVYLCFLTYSALSSLGELEAHDQGAISHKTHHPFPCVLGNTWWILRLYTSALLRALLTSEQTGSLSQFPSTSKRICLPSIYCFSVTLHSSLYPSPTYAKEACATSCSVSF